MEKIHMTHITTQGVRDTFRPGEPGGIYVRGQYIGPATAENRLKAERMLGNWKGTYEPRTREEIQRDAQRRLAEMNRQRGIR
jgi:hypothetical protein